jgi:hypothetical protein
LPENTISHVEYPVRIKTISQRLSSGFPYHPVLFDLHISPRDWNAFSAAITRTTKLTLGDRATIAATVAGVAATGLWGASIYAGKRTLDSRQAKQVRSEREEKAALGQVLKTWNENFFIRYGLEAQLEVSEAALRDESAKLGEGDIGRAKSLMKRNPLVLMRKEYRNGMVEGRKCMILLNPVGAGIRTEPVEMAGDAPRRAELPTETPTELPGQCAFEMQPDCSANNSCQNESPDASQAALLTE